MAQLYGMHDGYREHASRRCQKCGHVRIANAVKVRQVPGSLPHYVGLLRCGLVWECPTCSARIKAARSAEVRQTVEWHITRYGESCAAMLTLTVRHGAHHRLAVARAGIARAFRLFQAGAPWLRAKADMGLVGSIRALEPTHGADHGWHPHLHIVLLTRRPVTAAQRDWMAARWRRCVAQALGAEMVPDDAHGTDLRPCHRADYIAKLGLELTAPATKRGRGGHRTPFEILADFLDTGDAADLELFTDYVAAMRGARQLTWTRGLKLAAGVIEQSDEEIAEGEEAGAVEIGLIAGDEWDKLRWVKGAKVLLLQVARDFGARGLFFAIDRLLRRTPLGRTPKHRSLTPDEMLICARLPGGATVWL